MNKKVKYITLFDVLSILVFVAIIVLLISPIKYSNATLAGVDMFIQNVFPILLPFFFLTRLLMELGTVQKLSKGLTGICRKLFGISGIGVFVYVAGVISGYPTGAKLTGDFYEEGYISSTEAHRMTALVNNSGPMFVIGVVGSGFMLSAKIGVIILISHILGAICNGILYRKYEKKDKEKTSLSLTLPPKPRKSGGEILVDSVLNAWSSIVLVGVYIVLAYLFIEILLGVTGMQTGTGATMLSGVIEITRGALDISQSVTNQWLATVILTAMITFGGISVHLQALAFLSKCKVKYGFFLLTNITHAFFATAISCVLALLI